MKEQANGIAKSASQFWKSQSKKNRIIMLSVIALLVIVAVVLAVSMNKKETYAVLYTGLDAAESAQIVSEIQAMNVEVQVNGDGEILVPPDKENNIRMELATKGYPKTAYSYSIWTENVDMFTTDSQKREIVKMQLETRLKETIETLTVVDTAHVIIDIPENSNTVISSNRKEPTASVVLHLLPNMPLSSSQVTGIKHIVMTALSGLKEENITITDGNGNTLSNSSSQQGVDEIIFETQKLQFKTDFEGAIKEEILNLLRPAYGENGVNVTVNALFDYDKKVSESTTYTPSVGENGMVSNESTGESSGTSTGGTGNVVGVEPNADGTYPTLDGDGVTSQSWSEMNRTTSYLVNTLKEQTEKNGYYVEQVSISVVVYRERLGDTEKVSVINVICNAANTIPELVSVENIPLLAERPKDSSVVDSEVPVISDKLYFGFTLDEIIIYAIIIAIAILIILIIVATILSKIRKKKARKLEAAREAAEAERAAQFSASLAAEIGAHGEDIRSLSENQPETKEAAVRREIGEFSKNSPDIAAQLIKSWLRDGGDR